MKMSGCFTPQKNPVTKQTGWAPESVWAFWRKEKSLSLPHIQTPDLQDRIRDTTQLPTTLSPLLQGVNIVHKRLRRTHIVHKRLRRTHIVHKRLRLTHIVHKRLRLTHIVHKRLRLTNIVHKRLRLTHILSHYISVFNVSLCARKTNFNIIPIYERAF